MTPEDILRQVKATLGIEGMFPSKETEAMILAKIRGEITREEYMAWVEKSIEEA